MFAFLTDKAQLGTGLELKSIQKTAKVEYHLSSLSAFLRRVWYGFTDRLSYPLMVPGRDGGDALLYVPLESINSWHALRSCRLFRNMVVDPVLASAAAARLTETD